jgi:hypothetical protein
MLRALVAAVIVMTLAGCSRAPVKQAFAQCKLAAQEPGGAEGDIGPYISDCMEARGYEIKEAGYCYTVKFPELLDGCYRKMRDP